MRIGIDARMYRSGVAGIGRYGQNLIKNLLELDHENEYILFMGRDDAREFKMSKSELQMSNQMSNVKVVTTDIPHYSLAEQTKLPQILERENLDLMHFLNFNFPVRYRGQFISVIHDLTLFRYPGTARKTNFIKNAGFRYVMKKACQKSAKIIAVSKQTKKDIIKFLNVSPRKIAVIYEAADDKLEIRNSKHADDKVSEQSSARNIKENYKIDAPVILAVGQSRPHKNLPRLVQAFEILRKKEPLKLVLLGGKVEGIDRLPYSEDIVNPGFVSDEELALWYQLAAIFVFPSLYEGFGLPGLEAMAAGLPVVASNKGSLPEIYQEGALYFDPLCPEAMAAEIEKVLKNPALREKMVAKGYKIVQQYSWRKTAEETLKLYQELEKSEFRNSKSETIRRPADK